MLLKRYSPTLQLFILACLLILTPKGAIAVTSLAHYSIQSETKPAALPTLYTFISAVKNGASGMLTGVYVPGVLAYPVVQQVGSDAAYVSSQPETITQFRMAAQYNTVGLLAHDFLAGASFSNLKAGQEVVLIYGDSSLKKYQITEIQRYQALTPTSPYSNFVDLTNNAKLSAEQLFLRTYGQGKSTLVFQTCISTDKVSSWGRLFVVARPVEVASAPLLQALPAVEQALASLSRSLSPLQNLTANR
jgi:hypothetical protein